MGNYLRHLESRTMPLPIWGVVVSWFILYCCAHILVRKGYAFRRAQNVIVVRPGGVSARPPGLRLILCQLLLTGAIFASASLLGGPFFVFFACGWLVTTAVSIPTGLRSLFFLRAISQREAAKGSVTMSPQLVTRDQAYHLFGAAVFCLLLGVILAHLALIGGALFLSATAIGYQRRARNQCNHEAAQTESD